MYQASGLFEELESADVLTDIGIGNSTRDSLWRAAMNSSVERLMIAYGWSDTFLDALISRLDQLLFGTTKVSDFRLPLAYLGLMIVSESARAMTYIERVRLSLVDDAELAAALGMAELYLRKRQTTRNALAGQITSAWQTQKGTPTSSPETIYLDSQGQPIQARRYAHAS